MNRREFVVRAGTWALFVPASGLLVACEGDSATGDLTFTSSSVSGHTHAAILERALLDRPPAEGAQKATTSSGGHAHVVVLTGDDLRAIAGGATVMKSTSIESGHAHQFSFARASNRAPDLGSGY